MKKFKAMHSFEKALIAAFLFLLCVTIGSTLSSCGTIKKVTKSEVKTHEVIKSDSVGTTTKVTDTKFYGDTLKGQGFLLNDAGKPDSIVAESGGISLVIKYTAYTDTLKHLSGGMLTYTAIAKPVAKTNTHTVDNSTVNKSLVKDTKTKSQSNTTSKAGFSLPWYCWLILVALAALAGFLFLNRLKKL